MSLEKDEDEIFRTNPQFLARARRRQITVVDASVGQATTIAPSSSSDRMETRGDGSCEGYVER